MRLSSTALASFLLLSTGNHHAATPTVAVAFSPSRTTTKRSASATVAFNTPPKKVLTASDVLSKSQNQKRSNEEEAEEIPKLFSEEIYSDFQSALLKLEKRVKEGRGALSLTEVQELEAETDRIVQEMNAYLQDPEGMKKRIADGYASSSQGSPLINSNLSPSSTTHTIQSSVPPPASSNSFPTTNTATAAVELTRKPVTDISDDEGPAFDGKGYGLARGTTNTYVIPGMDQMSPEEYRTKLQETISARQAKRREESLRNSGGTIGNRSSSGYLEQLGRQQQQPKQQGEKNELFEVQRAKDSESRLGNGKMEQHERKSESSKDVALENHHGHVVPNAQNSPSTMTEEVNPFMNQSPHTPEVNDVHNSATLQNSEVLLRTVQSPTDSKDQTRQQQPQAIPRTNGSFQPTESVNIVQNMANMQDTDMLQPTIQPDTYSQQQSQQQGIPRPKGSGQPKSDSVNGVKNVANLQNADALQSTVQSDTDRKQQSQQQQQQVTPRPHGSDQPKPESVNIFQNITNLQNTTVLPPTIQSDTDSQQIMQQQQVMSRPKGPVQPKAESVMDYASLVKRGRAERELSRKSEWQTKGSTKELPLVEKSQSEKPLLKEEIRWFIENRQRPIPSSVPPAYAEVDEKFVGDASRQSPKSSSLKDKVQRGTWYDEKRIRPIPTADAPQRPKVFDRIGPQLESSSRGSKKSPDVSKSQHGKEKGTWYNEKRVRPSPNADVPQRPKVFDRTGTELESPLEGPATNSSLLRSLLQDNAPKARSKHTLHTFKKTIISYTASSEINQWWKDNSQRPKNYIRHYTPMNNNYEDRPMYPKNYGDMKLILTEWDTVESDAASDDDGDN
ncbi:hypothetical protein ACHAWX_002452 [Stephanocyclus meneghinianus]